MKVNAKTIEQVYFTALTCTICAHLFVINTVMLHMMRVRIENNKQHYNYKLQSMSISICWSKLEYFACISVDNE